jgi:phosphoglycerol transferase MdoB-like AlkP superfamily enzyme
MSIIKGGFFFDTVSIIYLNILWILIFILPFSTSLKQKLNGFSNITFFTINALGLLPNAIDSNFFQFNLRRSSHTTILEFGELNNFWALLPGFFIRYWSSWASWFLLLIPLWYLLKFTKNTKFNTKFHLQIDLFIILLFPLVAGLRGGNLRHATRPIGINNAGDYVTNPRQVSLVLNTPFVIFKTLTNKTDKRLSYFIDSKTLEKYYYPISTPLTNNNKSLKKLNVVILIIESYSEEASRILNKKPTSGGFTPFLDSIRLRSFYSTNSFSNGKKSIEALPAVLCGIPSFQTPFVLSQYATNNYKSLPKILNEIGYETSFFHGAPNGSMGFQAFCNLNGIDKYYGKNEFNNNQEHDGIWGIWDEPFLQFTAQKMTTFKQPFLSTVFTLSSHDPFKIPVKYTGKFKKGPQPVYETLAYTDHAVRKFFETAKKQAWFNNTIFVITGDHTSSQATEPEFLSNIGRFKVPIFFYCPQILKPNKSDIIIQQTDISPSVLALLNYQKVIFTFGKNVFDTKLNNFAINHFGVYQWYKNDYVLMFDGEKTVGLYNFVNDKILKTNLKDKLPAIQSGLELEVKAYLQQYQNRMIDNNLTLK